MSVNKPGSEEIERRIEEIRERLNRALPGTIAADFQFISHAPSDIEYLLSLIPFIKQEAYLKCAEIARNEKVELNPASDSGDVGYNAACSSIAATITEKSKS